MTKFSANDTLKPVPFNQRMRINLFRALGVFLIPPIFFISPYFDKAVLSEILEEIGVLLTIACVCGRYWATLYIGGSKNDRLVTTGPYSLCRNPLYSFSVMGVVGIGFMVQSLFYTFVLASVTAVILLQTVKKEESYLSHKFAESYVAYRNSTPRFLPLNFRTFQTEPIVNVDLRSLRRCFGDITFFILAIPILEYVEYIHEGNAAAPLVLF